MTFARLPQVVKSGDTLYLNDGQIELEVVKARGTEVECTVRVGGELRSRKGLNLPGIELGISAFTERDRECLAFALSCGVDAVSQSFVESAADLEAVRKAAADPRPPPVHHRQDRALGCPRPHRGDPGGVRRIMIARGDLGVEVPIDRIALVQKRLLRLANQRAKPVITATQMLESMTASRIPTRAEAADVANAILDGTNCVMLSAESAMGKYPVDATRMLAKIAAATEAQQARLDACGNCSRGSTSPAGSGRPTSSRSAWRQASSTCCRRPCSSRRAAARRRAASRGSGSPSGRWP